MLYILLSILFGIFASLKLSYIFFISIIAIILLVTRLYKKEKLKSFSFYLIIAVIFLVYTNVKISSYNSKYIDNEKICGEFEILSKEEKGEYYNEYICKNERKDKFILKVDSKKDILLNPSNKIYIEGKFKLPNSQRNEGGFNYRRYLNSQDIYGTITTNSTINLIDEGKINFINAIKNKIAKTFEDLLTKDYAGIINGMLNGDTKNVSDEILENFKTSGITHLLAVSGSNIAYIIMFFGLCANKIFGKHLSYYITIARCDNIYICFWSICISCKSGNNGNFEHNCSAYI